MQNKYPFINKGRIPFAWNFGLFAFIFQAERIANNGLSEAR